MKALMVHSKTWLTPLPDDNFEIRVLLEKHNDRVLRKEYNPASGLLPTVNLGGTELTKFVKQQSLGEFTGPVRIVKILPELFGLQLKAALQECDLKTTICISIADRSGSTTTLASKKVRKKLLSILLGNNRPESAWSENVFFNQVFLATIRSVASNAEKERYFVLASLVESGSTN
jgi:hypothetical protein